MNDTRGFTLIELMIVVAIVAVLAAIALSQYQDYLIRSQIAEGPSLAAGPKAAVSDFYAKTGNFPAGACNSGNASVGIASPASINGAFVSSVTVAGTGCPGSIDPGTILIVYSSDPPQKANSSIDGAGLMFEPVTSAGAISWHCKRFLVAGSVVLKNNWVPTSCR